MHAIIGKARLMHQADNVTTTRIRLLKDKKHSLRIDDTIRESSIFDTSTTASCDSDPPHGRKLAANRGTQAKEMV